MTDWLSMAAIIASVLVPWMTGALLARSLLGSRHPPVLYIGHGYLLGYLVVVLWVRFLNTAGVSLSFWPLTLCVLATAVLVAVINARVLGSNFINDFAASKTGTYRGHYTLEPWQWITIIALTAIAGLQFKFLVDEILLRPTFPWDAWRGWEPKSIQFQQSGSLRAEMGTIANYGAISPQIHLYTMLAENSGKSSLTHMPWLFAHVALCAAIYGQARSSLSLFASFLTAMACFTVPLLATHVALAGYADIWLTLSFTLGLFSMASTGIRHGGQRLLLVLLYSYLTFETKRAGLVLSLSLLITYLLFLARIRSRQRMLITLLVPASIWSFLAALTQLPIKISINVWSISILRIESDYLKFPGIRPLHFDSSYSVTPYMEALFKYGSWHLTFILFGASLLYRASRRIKCSDASLQLLTSTFFAATFFVGYFSFISYSSAADHTGLSRALMTLVPAVLLLMFKEAGTAWKSNDSLRAD